VLTTHDGILINLALYSVAVVLEPAINEIILQCCFI